MTDLVSVVFLLLGAVFFLAGTVGLLRLPDVYTRLHALTKADNIGVGFIVTALCFQADSLFAAGKLLLIWFLVFLAGAGVSHLIAKNAFRNGIKIWKR
ncbi:monovalent cation/H(+) antiporter subunit G [Sulfurimonas sediminis]|uniref:Monovalent cation/H(+) antiporter subunit G n=1 Tax=Sulfurimonas sediminis TaxID=2590020 RepID=A0A7M1AZV8_9BACT|nr:MULTISPECIES: monovalent cation/H(+) antiporter subunit G [Sulfurimonas]QOP42994.1 monovalent cation/H(+) antiporter subunit G [Sulfurimonas sediminis]UCN00876.1 monovalent cation/H(+) antiporter subunit G [Sulfurimonas sp. SWIR-19]